jgi:hypothetical protein
MSARFAVDLLHPGRVGDTWRDWLTGARGARRLTVAGMAAAVALLLVLVGGILPTYWRLSDDLNAIPRLQRDLATTEGDLSVLRANLDALTREAKRQVRWAELLESLSQHIPAALRVQRVEAARAALAPGAPQPGRPAQPPGPAGDGTVRIEAVTPARPGSPPLLEIARFMAGLMQDPAVARRFQLKSWEIKPLPSGTPDGQLHVSIVLAERPQ